MYTVRNGYLFCNNTQKTIQKVKEEFDISEAVYSSPDLLKRIFSSPIVIPIFKLYLLNDDESIKMDVSEDFISGSYQQTYQTGQRSSLSIELMNKDNKWTPKPVVGLIWIGSKFRLDIGVLCESTAYWKRCGIFLVQDPTLSVQTDKNTVSISMCDKFVLFDGGVFGKSTLKTIIPVGTHMESAFYTMLTTDRGNGIPYDNKKIIFPNKHKMTKIFYDIEQGYNENIGDIFTELGESISCEVYYNNYGNMVVQSGIDDYVLGSHPCIYRFTEGTREVIDVQLKENWSKMRNSIVVKGAIVNGKQFEASAKIVHPSSPYSIGICGEHPEVIIDEKIYSDELCSDRALYEIINRTRGVKTLDLSCTFLPFFDVNQSVVVDMPNLGVPYGEYIIDTISISIEENPKTSLSMTNRKEICLK